MQRQANITAIGTANPDYCQTQSNAIDFMKSRLHLSRFEERQLSALYKATGIETRYSVLEDFKKLSGELCFFPNDPSNDFPSTQLRMKIYKDNAIKLALKAINHCLFDLNNFNLNEITHIITISCTGMYAPGLDIDLIEHLSLKSTVQRTAINFMGCYGAFNGLKVAQSICLAHENAKVLMVSVELCSIHFQKEPTLNNIISSSLFADGAAAVLIESNSTRLKYMQLEDFQCDLIAGSKPEMSWDIANHGFDMVLSPKVPELIKENLFQFTQSFLERKKLTQKNIDHYAIHPGAKKILEAAEQALNISAEHNVHSYKILRQFGNMSSATILFVLKSIWNDLLPSKDNHRLLAYAFGPGLTIESMLLSTHNV